MVQGCEVLEVSRSASMVVTTLSSIHRRGFVNCSVAMQLMLLENIIIMTLFVSGLHSCYTKYIFLATAKEVLYSKCLSM